MKKNILIVAARFNEVITKNLVDGAQRVLDAAGVENARTVWVPGAYEIPVVCSEAIHSGKWDGIIALGCVIRGETAHFEYVAGPVASALMNLSVESRCPVMMGVLTTETVEQALNRSGLKAGNKGCEVAQALLETLATLNSLKGIS